MNNSQLDVWAVAKITWENTQITYRELECALKNMFGDEAVTYSSIQRKAKKEGWSRKEPNKYAFVDGNYLIQDTKHKIQKHMDSVVADVATKKNIILKHRRRLATLGELQESAMEELSGIYGLDIEKDSDIIKQKLLMSKSLSDILGTFGALQKIVAEQEFAVYQITPDDFGPSEADKRAKSLEMLGIIDEQERQARHDKLPQLMARLKELENANLDNFVVDIDGE